MDNTNTIGDRIYFLRDEKNVSMDIVAKALGTKSSTISDWENDKNLPGSKYLIALSEYFECSIDWILTGQGWAIPKKPLSISLSQTVYIVNEACKSGYNVDIELSNFSGNFRFEVYTKVYGARDRSLDIILLLDDILPLESQIALSNYKFIRLYRRNMDLNVRLSQHSANLVHIDNDRSIERNYMIHLHCPHDWFRQTHEYARNNISDREIVEQRDQLEDEEAEKELRERGFEQ